MSIKKYIYHEGSISELSLRFRSFEKLRGTELREKAGNQWVNKITGVVIHDFMISFFGKTGYGKSTTVNSFFGREVMETSDVSACTRVCNCLQYEISPGNFISLSDFPGIGESQYRDAEYLQMYKDFMGSVSVVVYVMRADTRDYAIDEVAYKTLFQNSEDKAKVIIGLNCCDKVEPVSRSGGIEPNIMQLHNINEKIKFIQNKFQPGNKVIPYSAATGWNMNLLADEIVDVSIRSGKLMF